MKVYVIYDPLLEKVVCVHALPNVECPDCKLVRDNRNNTNVYYLEELEREVFEPDVKRYDSPAILGYYDEIPEIDLKLETKTVQVEQRKLEHIADADEEDQQEEMQFHNSKTGKLQVLFDVLNKVYTVCYSNHEVGYKGEALYITLEAETEEQAKDKAMQNEEFLKHIEMGFYKRKYLSAYQPKGNYVIGKVKYYEGDPRL